MRASHDFPSVYVCCVCVARWHVYCRSARRNLISPMCFALTAPAELMCFPAGLRAQTYARTLIRGTTNTRYLACSQASADFPWRQALVVLAMALTVVPSAELAAPRHCVRGNCRGRSRDDSRGHRASRGNVSTQYVTTLSYFSCVPETRFFLSEPLFDVEFADKKNCIFSFFIFSKFVEQ